LNFVKRDEGGNPMDAIYEFADYVAKTDYSNLPKPVVENTKKFIIDTIGVGIAGLRAPGCFEAFQVVKAFGGHPSSAVLMSNYKCPAPWAAFVNSIFMHALDFDDTLDESPLHANVSVLPAALAMADSKKRTTGKDLLCAVTIGQDIACRIGASLKRPLAWTRTVTCGFFGATAAAGKVLKLDREKMVNAFGIAYCQTAGNVQCMIDGALVKRMQPAFAAKSAVLSTLLAEKGVTGTRNVLEGDFGFFKLYEGNEYDRAVLLRALGNEFTGMKLSMKPYPCCRMTHASIDAALQLKKESRIDPLDVEKITVRPSKMVYEMVGMPFQIRENPQVDAQFSIPYTVIIALLKGDVFLDDFEETNVRKQRMIGLTKKVEVTYDPNIDARDIMNSSIEIKMNDGRILDSKISAIKGSPMNPMSIEECMGKFKKCVAYLPKKLSKKRVDKILHLLQDLESLDDVHTLTDLLG
jgi:2-methylcitrate dehydratase PrpD